jgi:membrane protease subunit (stomatin/prohibitin family)
MAADLADFAGRQSIFVAPGAPADQQRMMALKASEQALAAASPAALGGAAAAHEALRVEAAHGSAPRFCTACGAAAAPAARFCAQCGNALQGVEA